MSKVYQGRRTTVVGEDINLLKPLLVGLITVSLSPYYLYFTDLRRIIHYRSPYYYVTRIILTDLYQGLTTYLKLSYKEYHYKSVIFTLVSLYHLFTTVILPYFMSEGIGYVRLYHYYTYYLYLL